MAAVFYMQTGQDFPSERSSLHSDRHYVALYKLMFYNIRTVEWYRYRHIVHKRPGFTAH